MVRLQLTIVSQERQLLSSGVDSLTVPASEGELTILPGHVPLVTKLSPGTLSYVIDDKQTEMAISQGFLTVSPGNQATVMVDSALHAREISAAKAEEAIKKAKETIKFSSDQRERLKAEAELRFALLQMKIAEKTKRTNS
jgi:F-type H+-transporting ATPase subunit epsilon